MLTLIVKATEYCNSNCVYCAVRDKESKQEKMSIDVLRKLFERIGEYLAADAERRVNITWHGGEPALMGVEFYTAVELLQQEILGLDAPRLRHTMQSNLTLLTDELVKVLKRLGVTSVGTSFEYLPGIRGLGPERDSDLYAEQFFRGFEVLRRHDLGAGAIFVVTSRTVHAPVEAMIILGNLFGKRYRGHFRINPLYLEGEASKAMNRDLAITAEQFGHFLGKAYLHWYPRRSVLTNVAPFATLRAAVDGEPVHQSCEEAGVCGNTHLSVSASGEVYQCGRAMDNLALHYGNIKAQSFEALFQHPVKRELMGRSDQLRATECAGCPVWAYCHGGCPVDSFIHHSDWKHKTNFCATKQLFLGDYVLPLHEQVRRRAKGSSNPERPPDANANLPRRV